jgi:N-acyl homoserine lactone hydrolase
MRKWICGFVLGESRQQAGRDIASYLRSSAVVIQAAFLTRLHFDHMAGALELPADTPLIVGKGEPFIEIAYGPVHARAVETVREMDFSGQADLPVFGPSADVLGDGSLWAVSTTGHSQGHVSFIVNSRSKPVLIMGDACALAEGLEKGIGPGRYCSD